MNCLNKNHVWNKKCYKFVKKNINKNVQIYSEYYMFNSCKIIAYTKEKVIIQLNLNIKNPYQDLLYEHIKEIKLC
jgi:hypothetical protein